MIYGLRTCTPSIARSLDATYGRAGGRTPLGTFLPQFIMGAMKELYASLGDETSPAVLTLKPQEIPLNHKWSDCMFIPMRRKPLAVTPRARALYGDQIEACLQKLQALAQIHGGLSSLQVFHHGELSELWLLQPGNAAARIRSVPIPQHLAANRWGSRRHRGQRSLLADRVEPDLLPLLPSNRRQFAL